MGCGSRVVGEPPKTPWKHAFRPRTMHCPYCEGKVIFTRTEDALSEKNCPHCGMRVQRREVPV